MGRPKDLLINGLMENDLDIQLTKDGNRLPFYTTACNMTMRCTEKYKRSHPTYLDCTIDPAWNKLSEFKKWFDLNYIAGWELDKDLQVRGNKIYGPAYCSYIPTAVNSFLITNQRVNNGLPLGVALDNRGNKYRARVRKYSKDEYLGLFSNEVEAHMAWQVAKARISLLLMEDFKEYPHIVRGLSRVNRDLLSDLEQRLITTVL